MAAQVNGNNKNASNKPPVEQEEEVLLRSIEKQGRTVGKPKKELIQKSASKWESFDRQWEDFEGYLNKPKWPEVREESQKRKVNLWRSDYHLTRLGIALHGTSRKRE
jgi:hypothetical protein